jgi:hypothetical protein
MRRIFNDCRWEIPMIQQTLTVATLLLASALSPVAAQADPLATGTIPDSARWIIHLNIDAARGTPLWDLGRARFVEPQRAAIDQKVRTIEMITGLKLPQDLHDVTLFGTSYDDTSICFYIHAPFNQETTTTFLKNDPEFTTQDHNGHTIITWRDKDHDRLIYSCFVAGDVAMVSPSVRMLGLALDTLDGKSPSLKPMSPLAPPRPATSLTDGPAFQKDLPVAWIAGTSITDLSRVQKVDSPFLQQVESASIAIALGEDKVSARVTAAAKSEKAAQQLYASAEGIKAMVDLSSSDEHAAPRLKMLASAMQTLSFSTEGTKVSADWFVNMEKVEAFADIIQAKSPPPGVSRGRAPEAIEPSTTPGHR